MRARIAPLERKLEAEVAGAEPEDTGLRVRFVTRIGARELSDRLELGPRGSLDAVHGVGRLLRLLRAGRIVAPPDPYALDVDMERAAHLVERCRGARVILHVRRRLDRVLTLWTEQGVERIDRVLDFREEPSGLWVRRVGGRSALRIERDRMVRYASSSSESFDILSVEVPPR